MPSRSKAEKPGPRPLPLVGWRLLGLSLMRDPIAHLTMLHRRYGPVCAWDTRKPLHVFGFGAPWNQRILSAPELFISDPFREVPVPKDSSMAHLRSGLLGLNGESHHRHRQLMQTAFRPARVDGYRQAIVTSVDRELAGWRLGERRDLAHDLHRLVLEIGMKTMFGIEEPAEVENLRQLVADLLAHGGSLMTMLLPFDLPGTPYRKALRTAEEIERFLRAVIEEKRHGAAAGDDILAALVAAAAVEGGMDDVELIGEAYTIFCHETSAAGMLWALFLLSQHPAVLEEVLEELAGELGGAPPTVEQLARLERLDHVLKETLRLLPPAFFGTRYTTGPCELGPFELEEGATVFFSQYVTHRMDDVFPEPSRFEPRRWEGASPSPYEYMPFGAGVHSCIAARFAMMEMKIVLAMVLQRFGLRLVPGTRIDRAVRISLMPSQGLPMVVEPTDRRIERSEFVGNLHEMIDIP